MSTRSYIGIEGADGVRFIYVHHDGYPSHHGPLLLEHYATQEQAERLLALGDLSKLDRRPDPNPGQRHSYRRPAPGVCIAYGRDRGETGTEAHTAPKMPDDEWCYLLERDGAWRHRYKRGPWRPLTDWRESE